MSEDAIKAALEAAQMEACDRDGQPIVPTVWVVAAFLNALPPPAATIRAYMGEVSAESMRDIYAYHRWLAAMVTRAANGDET